MDADASGPPMTAPPEPVFDPKPNPWIGRLAKCRTRMDAAKLYAKAIKEYPSGIGYPWVGLNGAIMDRWNLAALHYIKDRAWKIVKR